MPAIFRLFGPGGQEAPWGVDGWLSYLPSPPGAEIFLGPPTFRKSGLVPHPPPPPPPPGAVLADRLSKLRHWSDPEYQIPALTVMIVATLVMSIFKRCRIAPAESLSCTSELLHFLPIIHTHLILACA